MTFVYNILNKNTWGVKVRKQSEHTIVYSIFSKVCIIGFVTWPPFCTISNYAKQKHLGCKKVPGQSEAANKQSGATKSFDISYFIKNSIFFTIGFVTWAPFLYQNYYKGGQVTKSIVKICYK